MVCPKGCGRGSARAGSAAVGHSRLLAGGTKEEEMGEEDVSVLGLEGGEGGGDKEVVGQVACANLLVASCPPQEALVLAPRGSGKGQVSVLNPKLLRSFPATLATPLQRDSFACHGENYSFKGLYETAFTQFKILIHLWALTPELLCESSAPATLSGRLNVALDMV